MLDGESCSRVGRRALLPCWTASGSRELNVQWTAERSTVRTESAGRHPSPRKNPRASGMQRPQQGCERGGGNRGRSFTARHCGGASRVQRDGAHARSIRARPDGPRNLGISAQRLSESSPRSESSPCHGFCSKRTDLCAGPLSIIAHSGLTRSAGSTPWGRAGRRQRGQRVGGAEQGRALDEIEPCYSNCLLYVEARSTLLIALQQTSLACLSENDIKT